MSNTKILVVDDDAIFLMLTENFLARINFNDHVETFNNGEQVVEFLQKRHSNDSFYIMFLDINMPVMNGWQVLEKIKELQYSNLDVYMVTSSTDLADIERSKQYSFVKDYISKPLSVGKLTNLKEIYQTQ